MMCMTMDKALDPVALQDWVAPHHYIARQANGVYTIVRPCRFVNPRTERRLILLILSAMLLLNVAILTLAPRLVNGAEPTDEDVFEPPADEEGDALEGSRTEGLGEPDEVMEGFESGPPDDE